MRILCHLIFFCLLSTYLQASDSFTLSGQVSDSSTSAKLMGASVTILESTVGTSTNKDGFYSVTVPKGEFTVRYSMIGYETKIIQLSVKENMTKNILLSVEPVEVGAVQVISKVAHATSVQNEVGSIQVQPESYKNIPVIFGEQDIMKTIQLMPGVKSVREGESGFSVRGGGVDQNLVLLDDAVIYNASHLLGLFSIVNPEAIGSATLLKGTASSEYGGRLSSVLDIKTKEGSRERISGAVGIGLISSKLTLEIPLGKKKGSILLSGRRTYFDLFLRYSSDESTRNSTLYFYDVNVRADYRFGTNNRLFLSGYIGRDVFAYDDEFGTDWGNRTMTFRWDHIFNQELFLNSSVIYSKHDYIVEFEHNNYTLNMNSYIKDVSLKQDYHYFVNAKHEVRFGFNAINHVFVPGQMIERDAALYVVNEVRKKQAVEGAVYFNHDYQLTPKLSFNYGLRYSGFGSYGPGVVYELDANNEPVDSTEYKSGEVIQFYQGIEPRLSVNYIIDDASSATLSYARNRQYLHLLSTSTSIDLVAIWHPSTDKIKPGISDLLSIGYSKDLQDDLYQTSFELYYKDQRNLVDYKTGARIFANEHMDAELVFGRGWSYGAEVLLEKKYGKLTGWVGYTISRSMKKFDAIDDGIAFPARYDRTHEVTFVGMKDIGRNWTLSTSWVYHTGNAVTFPSGKYKLEERTINLYTERNGQRMPAYHRLDIAFAYNGKRSSWKFSLYNAYGRKNAYMINFLKNSEDPLTTEAVRLSLFSFFPAITYNFRW